MNKLQKVILIGTMASVTLCGCSISGRKVVFDIKTANGNTVFSINDTKCNLKEASIYLSNYKNLYGCEYGVDLWNSGADKSDLEKYIKDVTIDEMVRIYCMDIIAGNKEITLTDDEMKKVESASDEYYDSLTDAELDYMDITRSDVKQAYENYALAQKLYTSLTQGVDTEVSDDDARVAHLEQIYVTNSDTANIVEQKINAKDNFEALANSYNEASSIEIYAAKGDLPKEVEDVAFNLKDNEVSNMIATDKGCYFIKCISKIDRERTDKNKELILTKREQQQFNDDYNEFMESAQFELNNNLWDEIEISSQTDIKTDTFFVVYDKFFNDDV